MEKGFGQLMQWLYNFFPPAKKPDRTMLRTVVIPGRGPTLVTKTADCMGAMCPRPQLLTIKILSQIEPGEVIEVISDNPAAVESFPALMETLCCTHLLTLRDKDGWRLYLRKEPTDIFSDFILDRRN